MILTNLAYNNLDQHTKKTNIKKHKPNKTKLVITSHSCLLQILASKWFKYIYSNKNLKLAYSSVTKATTYSSAVTAN